MMCLSSLLLAAATLGVLATTVTPAQAQAPAAPAAARPQQAPQVLSPEVGADRRVTFRIYAPNAQNVRLGGGDLPNVAQNGAMTKNEQGVWELTTEPAPPGAYRYNFNVDGVTVIDPRNPATSESFTNTWSLVVVPGSEWMDTKNVPHGAVASVTYYSTALKMFRRMHVYTPPGYEKGKDNYPVFYLLHGSGDSDDAWSSVGRAGFILDNLIAAGKAKPMIVVMTAGHVRGFDRTTNTLPYVDEFSSDFIQDVMPYTEAHYRTKNDRNSRALAGLSMGGKQTIDVMTAKPDAFAYIGVYSSGLFGIVERQGPNAGKLVASFPWEEQNRAMLDNAASKKGLKLFWFATGKDDFLFTTTQATVDLYKRHGFAPEFKESDGGHTWLNWRDYLIEFAPRLFN